MGTTCLGGELHNVQSYLKECKLLLETGMLTLLDTIYSKFRRQVLLPIIVYNILYIFSTLR